ncbi:MAG: hypothetical protein NVSMB19_05470 [Vulcanimicrobiaceae bacterium]
MPSPDLSKHGRTALAAVVCAALAAAPARAATVSGAVTSSSIVWIAGPIGRIPLQEMRNVRKTFAPELIVVPVGGTIRFPNDDPFFHSIYSGSDADPFDIGFYETGPGKDVTFEHPGVLEIRCHIHASMHGTIVVVDGPFVRADGAFSFGKVAPGYTTVSAWNAVDGTRTQRVRVTKGSARVTLPREL